MKRGLFFLGVLLLSVYLLNPHRGIESIQSTELWRELALPFRLARMAAEPVATELVMPVQGVKVRQVADTWHADRDHGRKHEGQDIFARKGTPVLSATEGIVVRMGEAGIGGNAVFVMGPGGRTYYYAHLASFAEGLRVGDPVSVGAVLGYVGNTGNARTTPPHLHFGVYGPGGAENPFPLLVDREAIFGRERAQTDNSRFSVWDVRDADVVRHVASLVFAFLGRVSG